MLEQHAAGAAQSERQAVDEVCQYYLIAERPAEDTGPVSYMRGAAWDGQDDPERCPKPLAFPLHRHA